MSEVEQQKVDKKKGPDPQGFVAPYLKRYNEAMKDARSASETTMTPGWQNNYANQLRSHGQVVAAQTELISNAAVQIATMDTTEAQEKVIKDAVKALQEERVRHAAWMNRAVGVYKQTVDRCGGILDSCLSAARNAESTNSLTARGLPKLVSEIIAGWEVAKWDDKNGVVTFSK